MIKALQAMREKEQERVRWGELGRREGDDEAEESEGERRR